MKPKKVKLTYKQVVAERDEADRRAGAAERRLGYLKDSDFKREQWLDKAKKDAGYSRSESFDVVWDRALKSMLEEDALKNKVNTAIHFLEQLRGKGFGPVSVTQAINEALAALKPKPTEQSDPKVPET